MEMDKNLILKQFHKFGILIDKIKKARPNPKHDLYFFIILYMSPLIFTYLTFFY